MSDYSQTRSFNLGIAQDTSVEAALIYDGFTWMNDNYTDENGWFYQSYETLQRLLPFSKSTIRRAIDQLIEKNFIEKALLKINGAPTCHYRISDSFKLELSDSVNLEQSMDSVNLKHSYNDKQLKETTKSDAVDELLFSILALVNPKEKATADRRRALNARLKDYTAEEITGAAKAFSHSEWHIKNGQMSIDNLLAPSKFGRWYAQIGTAKAQAAANTPTWAEDDDGNRYYKGELLTPQNQDRIMRESQAERQAVADKLRKSRDGTK